MLGELKIKIIKWIVIYLRYIEPNNGQWVMIEFRFCWILVTGQNHHKINDENPLTDLQIFWWSCSFMGCMHSMGLVHKAMGVRWMSGIFDFQKYSPNPGLALSFWCAHANHCPLVSHVLNLGIFLSQMYMQLVNAEWSTSPHPCKSMFLYEWMYMLLWVEEMYKVFGFFSIQNQW